MPRDRRNLESGNGNNEATSSSGPSEMEAFLPGILHWDGAGKPTNYFEFEDYEGYRGTNKDCWISAKGISLDVLAHCLRRKTECSAESCKKFCCEGGMFGGHLNVVQPSLVLYVFRGARGFVISEHYLFETDFEFKLQWTQRELLKSQSWRYAQRNGFSKVDELSQADFGEAQWVKGSISPSVLRAGGAEAVGREKKSYAGATFCPSCGHWTPYLENCHKCFALVQDPDIDATLKGDPLIQAAVQAALAHRIDGQDVAEVTGIGSLIALGFLAILAGAIGKSVGR